MEFYLQHLERAHRPCSVTELADRLLTRLEREGKSHHHIQELTYRIRRFETSFGDRDIAEIKEAGAEYWAIYPGAAAEKVQALPSCG